MLDKLFKFPVILLDVENEERKSKQRSLLNSDDEEDYDIATGEAEYPFDDFIGIEDRWFPTKKSFQKALKGKFEACMVRFAHVVPCLVPLNKEEFKQSLETFISQYEQKQKEKHGEGTIIQMSDNQFEKFMEKISSQDEEEKKDE